MKIYFLGAANPETIRMMIAVQKAMPNVQYMGFLDNDPSKKSKSFYGYPILGGLELVQKLSGPDVGFVNLITGSTIARYETSIKIVQLGGQLVNFIHPSVDLTMVKVGIGLYIQDGVIVQAGVSIGDNTSIHIGSLIGHETIIGNSVFIAHAVSVSGCCNIGDGTFIGTNSTILPRINIGRWVTIGAGAVVTKDVPDYAVVVGNPAKIIRYNDRKYVDGKIKGE